MKKYLHCPPSNSPEMFPWYFYTFPCFGVQVNLDPQNYPEISTLEVITRHINNFRPRNFDVQQNGPLRFVRTGNGNVLPPTAVTPTTLSPSLTVSAGAQNWVLLKVPCRFDFSTLCLARVQICNCRAWRCDPLRVSWICPHWPSRS
jgi:hypothetical protein